MNQDKLHKLLRDVRAGRQSVDAAVRQLKSLATHDIEFARVDGHRALRKGFPEVIYCEGKSAAQVVKIARSILRHNDNLMATRAAPEVFRALKRAFPTAKYHEAARAITVVHKPLPKRGGTIAVLCAGTTDMPAAEEAAITADIMGNRVRKFYDVGVAGLHRLLAVNEELLVTVVNIDNGFGAGYAASLMNGLKG
jgi:NCAIR mutase (PurE)-related protein